MPQKEGKVHIISSSSFEEKTSLEPIRGKLITASKATVDNIAAGRPLLLGVTADVDWWLSLPHLSGLSQQKST